MDRAEMKTGVELFRSGYHSCKRVLATMKTISSLKLTAEWL